MKITPDMFVNEFVIAYIGVVFGAQWLYLRHDQNNRKRIASNRDAQRLPPDILLNHAERLADRRREAQLQSGLLLGTVLISPIVLLVIAHLLGSEGSPESGLAVTFVALMLWILISGTDLSKAFLGGLAFKTVAAFKVPFQIGDRVEIKGIGGKVIALDTFYLTLQTPNDDSISVPTSTLWGDVLTSVNGGSRSSLCVMEFYLSPDVEAGQRQSAEDAIWDAIQASVYYDPTQSMQIYLTQLPHSIKLTAKAYVASTYSEPLFSSDVTRAFLDFASKNKIALAKISHNGDEL